MKRDASCPVTQETPLKRMKIRNVRVFLYRFEGKGKFGLGLQKGTRNNSIILTDSLLDET